MIVLIICIQRGGIRKGKGKEEKEEKREKGREERKGAGKETGG